MSDFSGFGAIRSLDYAVILCDDLGKMRSFYVDVLRFQIHDEDPNWVGFQVGSLFLALRSRGRPYDGPKISDDSAAVQLSFRVPPADVDVAYQTLKEHDVSVIEEPTDQDWGHRTLYFADPENNVIEIYADIHTRDRAATPSTIHQVAGQ